MFKDIRAVVVLKNMIKTNDWKRGRKEIFKTLNLSMIRSHRVLAKATLTTPYLWKSPLPVPSIQPPDIGSTPSLVVLRKNVTDLFPEAFSYMCLDVAVFSVSVLQNGTKHNVSIHT